MNDDLESACEYLGVDKGSVLKHRVQGDEYIVIVDKGIKGCPKYHIPLSQLIELDPDLLLVPAAIDLNSKELSYRKLQELAKEQDIPANQKADALRTALWPTTEEEE